MELITGLYHNTMNVKDFYYTYDLSNNVLYSLSEKSEMSQKINSLGGKLGFSKDNAVIIIDKDYERQLLKKHICYKTSNGIFKKNIINNDKDKCILLYKSNDKVMYLDSITCLFKEVSSKEIIDYIISKEKNIIRYAEFQGKQYFNN